MKIKLLILTAAAAMSNLAVAETTTTTATTVLASADAANQAANSSVANNSSIGIKAPIKISYTGILAGPGMEFNAAKQKAEPSDGSQEDMFMSHRTSLKYVLEENSDVGVQARFRTTFAATGITAENEDSRLFMNFKKLLETELGSLTLTPRIVLPNKNRSHDRMKTFSPELIAIYAIEPKDSRFTFSLGADAIKDLYYSAAPITQTQEQFYSVALIEAAYQLTPKTQLTFGYYPEFVKASEVAYHNTSNEIDLGIAVDIAKGWSLNPMVGTEMNYLSQNSNTLLRSSQLSVWLVGSIL